MISDCVGINLFGYSAIYNTGGDFPIIILQPTVNENSCNRSDARWSDKPPMRLPLSGFSQKHAPGLEQTIQWFGN
jgi:hypothetical protein